MGKHQIDILGTSFNLESSFDDEYLKQLLNYYEKLVDTIETNSGTSNQLYISIMAGLALLDELFKIKKEKQELKSELQNKDVSKMEELTLDMIDKLSSVITDD